LNYGECLQRKSLMEESRMYQLTNDHSEPTLLLRQLASVPALFQAWRKVRANRGAAGVDAVSLQAFEKDLDANLAELARNLLDRTYEPMPARYVFVSKPDGRERELAIPTVRDRVAQRAVLDLIEPSFESQFLDCSFAFRTGRSVEMAIQRIVVARAHGYNWTLDADIEDFFPSIDHRLLLDDVARAISDRDLLRLIKLWLDAGALDGARPTVGWIERWKSSLASASMSVRDGVNNLLDSFLSERLGPATDPSFDEFSDSPNTETISDANDRAASSKRLKRAAVKRLVEDGVLLAIAERAALRGALGVKLLGLGGAAFLAVTAAPLLVRKLKGMASPRTGAMQGAPLSPLLSNVYLHPFDLALTRQGLRLVRYCDDFVIMCRSESDARRGLRSTEEALRERRLRLNPEKTRIVSPAESMDFLGYRFEPDGRVVAPASIPETVDRRVIEFADRYRSRAAARVKSTRQKASGIIARIKERLKR
jgi:RNA-directed DNA polymerase